MKIIEALKEIPLIQKRIDKNIQMIQEYSSIADNGNVSFPFETEEKQKQEIKSLLQSTQDLTNRRAYLSRCLNVTNATVKVKINDKEKTITEWISYKNGGGNSLIRSYEALNDNTGVQQFRNGVTDPEKGIKLIRFYSEKERNNQLEDIRGTLDKIDGVLEVINATTDLQEV